MIVNFQGNALGSENPCATCKGIPERWRACLVCAYARYQQAVIYDGVSDAEALARFVHWRELAGLTAQQAPLPTEAEPAPHSTRRASTPAGGANATDWRTLRGTCRGCGDDYPLILGVIQSHRVQGLMCMGSGYSPTAD